MFKTNMPKRYKDILYVFYDKRHAKELMILGNNVTYS